MKPNPKQTTLLAAVLITSLAGAATISAGKIGLVDVQKVIGVTKNGSAFAALDKKANDDLAAQAKTIQALQTKLSGNKAAPADQQALAKAQGAYQTSSKNYDAQRQKVFAPVASAVNTAVAAAAKAQGYTVVLDKRKAASSGIVIYVNAQATDLTAAVQKAVKK